MIAAQPLPRAGARVRLAPRALLPAALLLLAAVLLAALYRLNLAVPLNSDQGNSLIAGAAMRHGNLLLRGWVLPPDTFYTTRLPLLALLDAVEGYSTNLLAQSSAIFGVALVAAAVWLAQGGRAGANSWWGRLVTLALLVSPAYLPGNYLLFPGGSDHAGTLVLMLVALVLLDWRPKALGAQLAIATLLAIATVGDPMATWIGGGSIAFVSAVRLLAGDRDWRTEVRLVAAVAAGVAAASLTWHAIRVLGGFGRAGRTLAVVSPAQLPGHLNLGLESLLAVFGADVLGRPISLGAAPLMLHAAGLVLVAGVALAALRRWRTGSLDRVSQVLVAGIAIDLAAFVLNSQSLELVQSRYLLPALAFGAVLAGRHTPALIRRLPVRAAIAAGAAAYLVLTGIQAAEANPAAPPIAPVQRFLAARHLNEGLADYWEASVITASSSGRIRVRAVTAKSGEVRGYLWLANRTWYTKPKRPAHFVVLNLRAPGDVQRSAIIKAFGAPAEVHRFGVYEVLVWHANLYPRVAPSMR